MATQSTSYILMVRPARFGYNQQTAVNNAFQEKPTEQNATDIAQRAIEEFDGLVALLRAAGVHVEVVEDTAEPAKPDAVFPNNWITTHTNNAIITYPMYAPSRQLERREAIIEQLEQGFNIEHRIRFEKYEAQNRYLEGTGSMILDRKNGIAYACVSDRTDEELFHEFCNYVNYEPVLFHSYDQDGTPVYHTNVMMAMGTDYVAICMDSITDPAERATLEKKFRDTGKTIIRLSHAQMNSFAGNMLEVENNNGDMMLVMSEQAYLSLEDSQIAQISQFTDILYAPIYTIEKYGGGSVRCMMAEIFLQEKEIIKTQQKNPSYQRAATKTVIEKYDPEEGWVRIQ